MLHKPAPYRLFFIAVCIYAIGASGQVTTPEVYSLNGDRAIYANPWAGGMNSCQFGKTDVNLDGIRDLVVFDRCGNRIMPFLAGIKGGRGDFVYAPEYTAYFPSLSDWVIFADYDGDGKEDIFTYSPGFAGLKVYRNTSGPQLEYTLQVYPYLTSFQGGGYVNILVTNADYPAITDLDNDGDLDILSFWGLGSFVEMHRNMSVEKYGHRDSLDFIKTATCWGYFAESEESNEVTLDTCLRPGQRAKGKEQSEYESRDSRHTGSTFRVLDLNGDELPDLLLGDVDYPNLVALYNGGSADTARMVSYDWAFPVYDRAVDLFSMPSAFYEDVDEDGINDLLVSPFDPNPFITDNINSVWYYQNSGSDQEPEFRLQTMRFLQKDMIDVGAGAYPVFHDYDQDGLTDLFIGNYGRYDSSYYDQNLILHSDHTGRIALLRNTGTQEVPSFEWIDEDFAGVSELGVNGIMPAFGDMDGDGDADMVTGCEDGTLVLYINTAGPGEPIQPALESMNYQGVDVGAFSAPQLFDLNRDNLPDLIIGEKGGNINYYRNTGTVQKPSFTLVTDSLGSINVTDHNVSLDGYSVPYFYRDGHDRTHLLVGSEVGKIFYFTGIDGNLAGAFTESDTLAGLIGLQNIEADRGYRTAATLGDPDHNGVPDLVVGNFSGGLEYLSEGQPAAVYGTSELFSPDGMVSIYPHPVREKINIDVTDGNGYEISAISIMDMTGRTTHEFPKLSSIHFESDISMFPDGIYLLKIEIRDLTSNRVYAIFRKLLKIS